LQVILLVQPLVLQQGHQHVPLRRSARERKPNPKYVIAVCTSTFTLLAFDPIYFEAAKEPEWCKAMEEEMLTIQRNETWDLVKLPEGKNAIGLKWVFRTKYNADGTV